MESNTVNLEDSAQPNESSQEVAKSYTDWPLPTPSYASREGKICSVVLLIAFLSIFTTKAKSQQIRTMTGWLNSENWFPNLTVLREKNLVF